MLYNHAMRLVTVILAALLSWTGCSKPPPPIAPLSIDTQSDLRHDHAHLHGDPHRHDHEHEIEVRGAHTHPHAHGHRHAAPPHGGVILSLRLMADGDSGDQASDHVIPFGPHIEMAAEFPERVRFYFLSESENGDWKTWDVGRSDPVIRVDIGQADVTLVLIRSSDDDAFEATLDRETQAVLETDGDEIRLANWRIRAAGHSFDVPAAIVYRQGGLDVVLD